MKDHFLNKFAILTSQGLLKVSGVKAKDLLQGQFTCDLNEITPDQSRLGAHCNQQGRIISLFRIIFYQDHYYLLMPRSLVPLAINALKKYAVFYKAELTDVSDQFERIGYVGNQLENFIQPVPVNVNQLTVFDAGFILKISNDRYEIIGNVPFLKGELNTISEDQWKYSNIMNGFPAIYPETSEKFLPHEINLPALQGVSFNKGCYTGQEIIARMQYRGKLKTEMVSTSLTSDTPPTLSDSIVDFCKTGYNTYQVLMIAPKSK